MMMTDIDSLMIDFHSIIDRYKLTYSMSTHSLMFKGNNIERI